MSAEVIFVAHDVGGLGGMELHAERLIDHLLAHGRHVTVVARSCRLSPRAGLDVRLVRTPARPFALAYPSFFIAASAVVGRLVRRAGGVVHTTGAIVANPAGVCTVHYCHAVAGEELGTARVSRGGSLYRLNAAIAGTLSRAGERWYYRPGRVELLCAVSPGLRSELQRRFPVADADVRSVPNGVDLERFAPSVLAGAALRRQLGLAPNSSIALFAGGDWERKGLAIAVDALPEAPGWHLVVAGAGDPEPLRARAADRGVGARVHFLGSVGEMPPLYAAADAFVLPTAYETFSLVTYEAAASGLPLLTTRVNGVEDILRDGVNGWFISRDPGDLGRRLTELRDDPGRARSMAQAARVAVEGFSWEAMGDRYLALYDELSGKRPPR